jgi:Carboxypeptidase regulatory-like domain
VSVRNHKSFIGVVLTSALSVGVAADQRGTATFVPPPAPVVKFAAPWRPVDATSSDTKVEGFVIDVRREPVKNATVQLRDLTNGQVVAKTDANDQGEYSFVVADPGTYVVEMVMVDGFVAGLSNAVSLARYETLQTVVRLSGLWDSVNRNVIAVNNPASFLGMSSAATMTAATLVIAGENQVPATNPGEPVSP